MEMLKLGNHSHYYHTHEDFFHHSTDLVHAFLMKDYDIGMHEQEFFEINIISRGCGTHYINNNTINANVGDVFIIPPKISHGYVGGEGFDVFHIILSDAFMNKYIADLQNLSAFYKLFGAEPLMRGKTTYPLHLTLSKEELTPTLNILFEIARYINYSDPTESLIRSNLAMASIGLLCNTYAMSNPNSNMTQSEEHALMESISYIHEKYYEKIKIDTLLQIAHMSRTSYIKKFKEICKMSPAAYITKIRLDAAMVMIQTTSLSVSEIAYKTGFYDASHLTKTFETLYHTSPMSYRERH
jgi:AraC family L-rhamnose operon transcriptional activator RhaR/AraC family L-rhamnose operon regulatory protein RhaS